MMDLPQVETQQFWQELEQYEKEKQMPYITSVERLGMERGKREGLLEGKREGKREGLLKGITSCLKVRFGAQGLALLPAIQSVEDVDRLEAILTAVETASDLDEIRPLCA
jgi:predicted transposase YdaD